MAKHLEGKVAVVTGGSRGLGRAMAVALAQEGCKIAIVGRDQKMLAETASLCAEAGSEGVAFATDVTSEADVAQLGKDVIAKFGRVDILVNNAGINIRKNIDEFTLDEWNSVLNTNLTSAFLLCRAFVPA